MTANRSFRFRVLVWVGLGGLAVLLLPLADALYRSSILHQAEDLRRRIASAHPDREMESEVLRLGETSSTDPSLFRDLRAWAWWRLGWRSELDFNASQRLRNGYYTLRLHSRPSGPKPDWAFHVFVWSPRRMTFVPWRDLWRPSAACPRAR